MQRSRASGQYRRVASSAPEPVCDGNAGREEEEEAEVAVL